MSGAKLNRHLPPLVARLVAEVELSQVDAAEALGGAAGLVSTLIVQRIPKGGRRQAMALLTQIMRDSVAQSDG